MGGGRRLSPLRYAAESRRQPGGFSQRDLTQLRSLCTGRDLLLSSLLDFLWRILTCSSREYPSASLSNHNSNFSAFIRLCQLGSNFDASLLILQVFPPGSMIRSTWIRDVLVFSLLNFCCSQVWSRVELPLSCSRYYTKSVQTSAVFQFLVSLADTV